jgi:hypothetical protein
MRLRVETPQFGSDVFVVRVLTSRPHGRPVEPPCYHGDPYPGFYLGILGGPLQRGSWVDLRALDDVDANDANNEKMRGELCSAT